MLVKNSFIWHKTLFLSQVSANLYIQDNVIVGSDLLHVVREDAECGCDIKRA